MRYCDKLGERPWRHWEQTLTFLYPVPPYLGASGQLFQVFNCPQLGLRDQMELYRIWKLEYIIAFFFLVTIFLFSKVMDNRDNVLFPQ